jgi:hypothetical protein
MEMWIKNELENNQILDQVLFDFGKSSDNGEDGPLEHQSTGVKLEEKI